MDNFHTLLGGLVVIDKANMNETLNLNHFLVHDHANDHGPALYVGPLSFFQTDGLGEDINHLLFDDGGLFA